MLKNLFKKKNSSLSSKIYHKELIRNNNKSTLKMGIKSEDYLEFLSTTKTPHHLSNSIKNLKNVQVIDKLTEIKRDGQCYLYKPTDTLCFVVKVPKGKIDKMRMVVTHSDSPCFKLKGNGLEAIQNYQKENNQKTKTACKMPNNLSVPIRPYGGGLFHTFFDRILTLSGLVVVRKDKKLKALLVDRMYSLMLPSLPPHLNYNSVYEPGKFKFEIDKAVVLEADEFSGIEIDCKDLNNKKNEKSQKPVSFSLDQVVSHDLCLIDTQEPVQVGKFIHSSRQDNLLSTFAGLESITQKTEGNNLQVLLVTDFEEIGSEKLDGALSHTIKKAWTELENIVKETNKDLKEVSSLVLSVDVSHAYNPNYSNHYDSSHKLEFGESISLKRSNNYATDLIGESLVKNLCKKADVNFSVFENRVGIRGGGTVGSMLSCLLGIRVVDIGTPIFAMHSVREMSCWQDVEGLTEMMKHFFSE